MEEGVWTLDSQTTQALSVAMLHVPLLLKCHLTSVKYRKKNLSPQTPMRSCNGRDNKGPSHAFPTFYISIRGSFLKRERFKRDWSQNKGQISDLLTPQSPLLKQGRGAKCLS